MSNIIDKLSIYYIIEGVDKVMRYFKRILSTLLAFILALTSTGFFAIPSYADWCNWCDCDTTGYWKAYHTSEWGYHEAWACSVCGYEYGTGTKKEHPRLSTPTGVSATTQSSSSINVSWSSVSGASGYRVYYRAGSYDSGSKTTSSTSCTLTSLLSETTYTIYVQAYDSSGYYQDSYDSSSVSATTSRAITYISAPAITLTPISPNQINVSWSKTTATTNYTLQWSTASNMSSAKSATVTGTSYSITELLPNTTYYVRIRSNVSGSYYASNGYGSTKNAKTLQDPLETPQLSSLHTVNCNSIDVSFSGVENATGYVIEYSTDALFTNKQTITVS